MDLFPLIKIKDACLVRGELFIPEGERLFLDRLKLDVKDLKEIYGNELVINLAYAGKLVLKAAIFPEEHSYIWIAEKKFVAGRPSAGEMRLNLEEYDFGRLEFHILALEDSLLFPAGAPASAAQADPQRQLYEFLAPSYDICQEESLYYRFDGAMAYYSYEENCILLKSNSHLDLLTYFNAFSAVKWRQYTNVQDLEIFLDFEGEAWAELICLAGKSKICLQDWQLSAKERCQLKLEVDNYPACGIIGLEIHALGPCKVYGGGYYTSSRPVRELRLGIGITTFRREKEVKSSVARLIKAIKANPLYKNSISVTVVDNGQTLTADDFPGALHLPNRNLGGSGGFMRSLIHYKDDGSFTHCLFMDDDAACEPGSIFRSLSFLKHALDDRLSICGAMLFRNVQFLQWESGAWFDQICHGVKRNYDLRKPETLLKNEKEYTKHPLYAGWWFFMFPIKWAQVYTFPFFVRGDDVEFSYLNDFLICTLNGVCSWQEDFKSKESPQTVYFDFRSHLVHQLVVPQALHSRKAILKRMREYFGWFNDSYQYDTAKSITRAFNGVLQGPDYWLRNMETDNVRKEISALITYERRKPLADNYKSIPDGSEPKRLPILHNFMRGLSLNGHLLPPFMLDKKKVRLNHKDLPNSEKVFLRKKVLVYNSQLGKQWLIGRNTKYYIYNLARFYWAAARFLLNYGRLQKRYAEFYKKLGDDGFWKSEFEKDIPGRS